MQKAVRRVCTTLKYSWALSVPLILIVLASVSTLSAQPRFEVPLRVTDGVSADTLYFGIIPNAVFGLRFGSGTPTDSINGHEEFELPPFPPSGVFEARFVWPRAGGSPEPPVGFGQGSPNDYRPYVSAAQRDSFRVKAQLGVGTIMLVSWPSGLSARFTGLTITYFDGSGNVTTDMLTNTSVDISLSGDPATANIRSAGLTSVEEAAPGIPQEFALNQNYPNPFNPTTTMQFSVAQAAMTDISVYDILGKKVATLASTTMTPGYYKVTWDGTNSIGSAVASGVYFVRMTAQAENGTGFSAMRKLLLMK
jgi:hypothetical protein